MREPRYGDKVKETNLKEEVDGTNGQLLKSSLRWRRAFRKVEGKVSE